YFGKAPFNGKVKIFEGVLNYLKSDETLVNDTFKVLEKTEQNAMDDVELWQNVSKDIDLAKQDVQYKMQVIKEARDKLQELVANIKNLNDAQKKELAKLLGLPGEDYSGALLLGEVALRFGTDAYVSILQQYDALNKSLLAYYQVLNVYADKTNEFLKCMSDVIVEIGENNRKLHEMFKKTGALQDLGKIAGDSIRLKKSIEVAKPKMEELAQKTRETVPVIAGNLQTLQKKVPGFYTDVNMGLDLANTFMDSANKLASHKIDIPAAARNIGNIDLSNSLRDFGVSPEKINEYIAEQNATNNFMNTTLDIMPILNVPKEAIQMYEGKELDTERKYGPSDYAMGVLSLATGGTVKTVGKVVGTVADLEKKAKNLEKAAKSTKFTRYPTGFDDVAKYIKEQKKLPDNYITKKQAETLGWKRNEGNLHKIAPGKSIGGDIFGNKEGLLPKSPGRTWYEADINYLSGYRGNDRILYSNDGLIYKTSDHYKTFTEVK
ncbi:ribonuclease domain-containing protein, partial [Bacillus pseudomycoides]